MKRWLFLTGIFAILVSRYGFMKGGTMKRLVGIGLLIVGMAGVSFAAESHADQVIATILENVKKIKEVVPDAVPMAFWDFDGTILKGDVTTGLKESGQVRYAGMAELAIRNGFSPYYKGEKGVEEFTRRDYPHLRSLARWLAYPLNAQILCGTRAATIDAFCIRQFDESFAAWYFSSSVRILRALEEAGVENHILSASPELFVLAARKTLELPADRFNGIRVAIDGGVVTERLGYPLPSEGGKTEILQRIVRSTPHGYAVAAFGNSYVIDADFLRYVVTQPPLPNGAKGTSMMINGGNPPPAYEGLFLCVQQDDVVGPAKK